MKVIFFVDWEEVEFGWGNRPDGFSLHLTPEAAEEYKKLHYEKNEYYIWFGHDVGFRSIPDSAYATLERLINETDDKLGVKSDSWSLKTAIEELTGEQLPITPKI